MRRRVKITRECGEALRDKARRGQKIKSPKWSSPTVAATQATEGLLVAAGEQEGFRLIFSGPRR
jgi:hypothetical protein